jgi:DNA-binding transcriptional MerR regulator
MELAMIEKEYSLNELAREYSDTFPEDPINVRTLRFYISEGLIPGPGRVGPGRHYEEKHMVLLQTIRRMQQTGTSISTIRQTLSNLSPEHQLRGQQKLLDNLAIQEEVLQNRNGSVERANAHPVNTRQARTNAINEEGVRSRCFRIFPGVEIIIEEELALEHRTALSDWISEGKSIFYRKMSDDQK